MEHHALASETMNHSHPIPHDVMLEILSRVPGRSLVRFRCVCKLWSSFFRDPHFISLQLNHAPKKTFFGYSPTNRKVQITFYSFEIEAGKGVHGNKFTVAPDRRGFRRVSNACNGLIAFYSLYCAHVVNPFTREWIALPEVTPHGEEAEFTSTSFLGLGFSTAIRKHKLVRLFSDNGYMWACEVLTLGTDCSWRYLGCVPYRVAKFQPAYANGFVYWMIDTSHYEGPERILSFDVDQEEFTAIRPPECHSEPNGPVYHHLSICVLEGSLCVVDWRVYVDDEIGYYFPVMRIHVLKDHKPDSAWTERHVIRFKRIRVHAKDDDNRLAAASSMFPISIQNGKLLLYCPNETWKLCDLQTGVCSKIRLPYPRKVRNIWARASPFVCEESIVPVDFLKNR